MHMVFARQVTEHLPVLYNAYCSPGMLSQYPVPLLGHVSSEVLSH